MGRKWTVAAYVRKCSYLAWLTALNYAIFVRYYNKSNLSFPRGWESILMPERDLRLRRGEAFKAVPCSMTDNTRADPWCTVHPGTPKALYPATLNSFSNAKLMTFTDNITTSSSNNTTTSLPDAAAAVARYQAVRHRMPASTFPEHSIHRANLEALCDEIDCFVLDGFGVLNVGDDTVPGAVERVSNLRKMGKQVRVLTNGASFPATRTRAKYEKWGMPFSADEVVSSRDALAVALKDKHHLRWGFVALDQSEINTLCPDAVLLGDNPVDYESCDGFVLLGAGTWTPEQQVLLADSLQVRPRPLLVGNPDLVAPHPGRLSQEPGWYAHLIADSGAVEPAFYGKPFDNAFELIRHTVKGTDPQRIAMVGDTLHTDILGGAQAGWRTVLVTDHGLLKGMDVEKAIVDSAIRPDFIVPTT